MEKENEALENLGKKYPERAMAEEEKKRLQEEARYMAVQNAAVYAGPDPAAWTRNSMLMVYAGPAQMNVAANGAAGIFGIGMMAQMQMAAQAQKMAQTPAEDKKPYKKCPFCDNKCDVTAKFCTNCGKSLEGVEVTE